ncbi:MAG: NUDIX domain-containing protein [Gammaproteobacteria bacterium]|nr:NUDIX domain-containing protein [Gammaproteobacteria bacterium]MDH5629527.1 NUDIX domain-containing protein [Gammaproteobacteria bacterium]
MKDEKSLLFKLHKSETLYDGFMQLKKYTLSHQHFQGGWSDQFTREVLERGNAAAVLLYDPTKEVLGFVEQFRPGAICNKSHPWLLELVAGMIDTDETPEAVAVREAKEEAGCEVKRIIKMCDYLVSPGGTSERFWLFLGEIDSEQLADYAGLDSEHEDIKVHKIKVEDAFEMLQTGKFDNAMTIIAVQWLKLNWQNRKSWW